MFSAQAPLITDATPYSTAFVQGVFHDALGRAADAAGVNLFVEQIDQGTALDQVTKSVTHSGEYDNNFIQSAYQQYLGRAADPGAASFWLQALQAGASEEQVVAALLASDEFYERVGGDNMAWVTAVYQAVLDRQPEATALEAATSELAAGASRRNVAYALTASLEHERQVVVAEYVHYLQAIPNASDTNFWATQLATGQMNDQTLAADLMTTEGYYQAQTGVPESIVPMPIAGQAWTSRNAQIDSDAAQGAQLAFFGDSITEYWNSAGQAVWNQNYAPLGALNAGIVGDRTQNLLWRIENGNLNGISPKVAVVMIGVDNIILGDNAQQTAAGVAAVVEALQQRLPNTKILVLGLLPGNPPFAPPNFAQTISVTNQLISTLADNRNVFYLDMGLAFLNADGSPNGLLYQPGLLHPNAQGFAVWAQTMAPELDAIWNVANAEWRSGINP
ncbi:MAG TPA: GDSL-type esterase/lipase family protein [Pirellulales bacterium]|nr:GDSL-type esterase/lipase family protein [Pirellulales bacterium]